MKVPRLPPELFTGMVNRRAVATVGFFRLISVISLIGPGNSAISSLARRPVPSWSTM